jgi:hypothetical protein
LIPYHCWRLIASAKTAQKRQRKNEKLKEGGGGSEWVWVMGKAEMLKAEMGACARKTRRERKAERKK